MNSDLGDENEAAAPPEGDALGLLTVSPLARGRSAGQMAAPQQGPRPALPSLHHSPPRPGWAGGRASSRHREAGYPNSSGPTGRTRPRERKQGRLPEAGPGAGRL